ncbi:polyprenyl synthetase family protein [Candidatus Micrarchaeota archaeon]|nr:polyprenyl synthetase family protein [Candidatus Micrarchaeota archaeon]MBU1930242.1 polyprenyl synthetase family protein [Candidatus Micrarchaeota archaeon]
MPKETNKQPIEAYLREILPLVDREIEKIVPRILSPEWLEKTLGKADFVYDPESLSNALSKPIWDLLDRGGKRWRPGLLILSCEALGGKKELALKFTPLVEIIHNGTLVSDDIEDSSEVRRGKPCIHKIFGIDIAVNLGSAMCFLATPLLYNNYYGLEEKKLLKLNNLVSQEVLKCHAGQAMDIYWHRGQKYDVTEKEYLQMCAYKTGTLARLAAKIGAVLGDATQEQLEALGKFAETIGIAFQIQDDILNLTGEKFQQGKGIGEDIHEGKRTLMVIHSLHQESQPDKKRLLEILNSHPEDQATIVEAILILKKNNSIEYAKEKARTLVKNAWQQLDTRLEESQAKKTLKSFADYLIEREI